MVVAYHLEAILNYNLDCSISFNSQIKPRRQIIQRSMSHQSLERTFWAMTLHPQTALKDSPTLPAADITGLLEARTSSVSPRLAGLHFHPGDDVGDSC